jgi:PAS domain S-box-containing protein
VNAAFERTFGYSQEELLSTPFLDITHPDDVERSREPLGNLLSGKDIIGFESRVIGADGAVHWIQWNTRTMPERGVVYGVGRDVTDRRRAEAELHEARRQLEASRDELRVLADEQAALRRVATLVARASAPADVFAAVAGEVGRLLAVNTAVIFRYEDDGTGTVVANWGDRDAVIPVGSRMTVDGETVAARVRRTGRSALIDDYATGSRGTVSGRARALGVNAAVGSPIVVHGRLWGAMVALSLGPEPLPADAEERIGEFTQLVATAISNIEARSQLAASRARIVVAADEERRRVVRDLHDGAQQRLVHTVITLKLARRALDRDDDGAPDLVAEALAQAERANAELRELVHGILPAVLSRGGLRAGVNELASRTPLPVDVDIAVGRLPPAIEATAYFVVAEALTNVAKHSKAHSAAVSARVDDGTLALRVRDDGVGGARDDGTGLVGLADRLAAVDGSLQIDTSADGTLVAAAIPIPADAPHSSGDGG